MEKHYTYARGQELKYNYAPFPKELLFNDKYKHLRLIDKMVYSLLIDRIKLSEQTNQKDKDAGKQEEYVDENGHVFCKFTNKSLAGLLDTSEKNISKSKEQLQQAGLLKTINPGGSAAGRLYPLMPDDFATKRQNNIGA